MIMSGGPDGALTYPVAHLPRRGSDAIGARSHRARFLVSIGHRDLVVSTSEIAWIRADGYCATLVTHERKEYPVRISLDRLERELEPECFIRIHRSAIINVLEVRGLERTGARSTVAVLRQGARIPVSRTRREALVRILGGV